VSRRGEVKGRPAGRRCCAGDVVLVLFRKRNSSQIAAQHGPHDVTEESRHQLPAEAAAEPPPTAWRLDSSTENHRHLGLRTPGSAPAHDVFDRSVSSRAVRWWSALFAGVRWCPLVVTTSRSVRLRLKGRTVVDRRADDVGDAERCEALLREQAAEGGAAGVPNRSTRSWPCWIGRRWAEVSPRPRRCLSPAAC